MMEDPSSGNDGRSIDAVVSFRELPEEHLFQSVYETYGDPDDYYVDKRSHIDWNAVTQRLMTPNGALEARQWVDMGRFVSKGLFFHLVCNSGTGRTAGSEIGEQYLRVVIRTIEVYPEALHFSDDRGYYPLHLLCGNGCFHRFWSDTTAHLARQVFKSVLFGNPEAAKVQTVVHQMTPLHCFTTITSLSSRGSAGELEALEMLLDVFPDAVRLRDVLDCLPLHHACCHRNFLVVKTLLDAYPEAIQLLCKSRSCLQECLRFCRWLPGDYDVARLLLEACPWFLANDDGERSFGVRPTSPQIEPSGDVLDYIYFNYWNGLELWRYKSTSEEGFQCVQYFQSNAAFLDGRPFPVMHFAGTGQILEPRVSEEYIEATFDMIVHILLTMYGRDNRASPLHAAVYGSLCRPWNLAVFKEVVSRFADEAQESDRNGNLPLHLFLKSCMIQRERAIEKHFVGNGEEYEDAVVRSLRILLGAHADAAAKTNGDGRLPLHLALDHHSLSFETAVAPLLDLAPRSLLARDTKTGLYPFMNASVGANANVDMTYRLLRRDPTALLQVGVSADNSHESRKRKRE